MNLLNKLIKREHVISYLEQGEFTAKDLTELYIALIKKKVTGQYLLAHLNTITKEVVDGLPSRGKLEYMYDVINMVGTWSQYEDSDGVLIFDNDKVIFSTAELTEWTGVVRRDLRNRYFYIESTDFKERLEVSFDSVIGIKVVGDEDYDIRNAYLRKVYNQVEEFMGNDKAGLDVFIQQEE